MSRRFDLSTLKPCGAMARTTGKPCRHLGTLKNGRCKLHGGRSTGPKTEEGKAKARRGNWKGGRYSAPARLVDRYVRGAIRIAKAEYTGARGYVPILGRDMEQLELAITECAAMGRELARLRGEE